MNCRLIAKSGFYTLPFAGRCHPGSRSGIQIDFRVPRYHRREALFCFLFSFLFLILSSSVTHADDVDRLYDKAAKRYHELLFQETELREKEDNWLRTIKQFQFIYTNYPSHEKAPRAIFSNGMLYRSLYLWNSKKIFLDKSNIDFRKLVSKYPESNLADDAQFLIAENYDLHFKNKDLAQVEYLRVIEIYPKGTAAEKAKERLKQFKSTQSEMVALKKDSSPSLREMTAIKYGGISEEESQYHEKALISKVDYWSTLDWSRMVINVKSPVRYKYQLLKEDERHRQKRFYIDVNNAYITKGFKRRIAANDGLISQARIAQFDKETVRIVLDLESLEKVKVFHFSLPNQYKIVIDILGQKSIPPIDTKEKPTLEVTELPGKTLDPSAEVTLSKALGLKVNTIVIDPGHGGKDPGAIAFRTKEKDLVLSISKELKKLINKHAPSINVLLTRSSDRFIELEARTAFANENKADLFVSIHVNASVRPKLSGAETYFLNLTTDDDALSLAAKENQTSLKSISDLQAILNDLMTNSKINESKDLAGKIQASLVEATKSSPHEMRDLGVKQAPFTVLIGAQMPCVLVETGFLSNKTENRFLRSEEYRRTIAKGIFAGLKDYMN